MILVNLPKKLHLFKKYLDLKQRYSTGNMLKVVTFPIRISCQKPKDMGLKNVTTVVTLFTMISCYIIRYLREKM